MSPRRRKGKRAKRKSKKVTNRNVKQKVFDLYASIDDWVIKYFVGSKWERARLDRKTSFIQSYMDQRLSQFGNTLVGTNRLVELLYKGHDGEDGENLPDADELMYLKFCLLDSIYRYSVSRNRKTTGKPYVVHPLSTASVLVEHGVYGVDDLIRALYHDVGEEFVDYQIADHARKSVDVVSRLSVINYLVKCGRRKKRKAVDRVTEAELYGNLPDHISHLLSGADESIDSQDDDPEDGGIQTDYQELSDIVSTVHEVGEVDVGRVNFWISELKRSLSGANKSAKRKEKKRLSEDSEREVKYITDQIEDVRHAIETFSVKHFADKPDQQEYGLSLANSLVPSLVLLTRGTKENYYKAASMLFNYDLDSENPVLNELERRYEDVEIARPEFEDLSISQSDIENSAVCKFADRIANTREMRNPETEKQRRKRLGNLEEFSMDDIIDAFGVDKITGETGWVNYEKVGELDDKSRLLKGPGTHPGNKKSKSYFKGNKRLYTLFKNIILIQSYRLYKEEHVDIRRVDEIDRLEATLLEETANEAQQIIDHLCSYHTQSDLSVEKVVRVYQFYVEYRNNGGFERATSAKVDITKDKLEDMGADMFDGLIEKIFDTRILGDKEPLQKIYRRKSIMLAAALSIKHLCEKYRNPYSTDDFVLDGMDHSGIVARANGDNGGYKQV